MTTPTPSPRPAALVIEAMANAVLETASFADATCLVNPKSVVIEAIRAASDMGWTLIPRAELEEAARHIAHAEHCIGNEYEWDGAEPLVVPCNCNAKALEDALRQRSRG